MEWDQVVIFSIVSKVIGEVRGIEEVNDRIFVSIFLILSFTNTYAESVTEPRGSNNGHGNGQAQASIAQPQGPNAQPAIQTKPNLPEIRKSEITSGQACRLLLARAGRASVRSILWINPIKRLFGITGWVLRSNKEVVRKGNEKIFEVRAEPQDTLISYVLEIKRSIPVGAGYKVVSINYSDLILFIKDENLAFLDPHSGDPEMTTHEAYLKTLQVMAERQSVFLNNPQAQNHHQGKLLL